jgi:peptidoglycan/LPS O-acetylase OafA/YrhL
MNLDDLMAVWRSQDAAPLHDVNKTLLHLALRQDEAKLQKEQRRERWIVYVASAGAVVGMAIFLCMMLYRFEANGMTGWDLVVPVIGAAAALISVCAIYVNHRAQSRREQRFGESLRDQLNRSIAQLDHQATSARRTSVLVLVLMGGILPIAILVAGWRVNQKPISDDGFMLVTMILWCVWSAWSGVWVLRREVLRNLLPRKRRLEALLKEIEAA